MSKITSSALTRRSFLKTTAVAAGAAAVSATAGCTTVSEQPQSDTQQEVEEKTFINTCRGNCGGPCELTGYVREGKLVKVTPTIYPEEARINQMGCMRSYANPQRLYSTNRVLYPMRQTGERGSDNWERITWDEAFELIAQKFGQAVQEFGDESVAVVPGFGNYLGVINGAYPHYGYTQDLFLGSQFGQALGYGMFMRKTGFSEALIASDATTGWMSLIVLGQAANSTEDVLYSKTVLLWGTNPADTLTSKWPLICSAREKGAKIVTIDPQYSKSAAGSDMWVPVRTGTDSALMLAMCNHIIDNGLEDEDYLKNGSVAPLLMKEDGMYLRLSDLGMEPFELANADGSTTPVDTEVVYDEAIQSFASSRAAASPALHGSFDANGIKVRTVYDAVLENIKPYTVEFAAEECGLPAEQIIELAELYATNKPAKIMHFCGSGHYANAWRYFFSLSFLAALTGNACTQGGGYGPFDFSTASYRLGPKSINRQALAMEGAKEGTAFSIEALPQILETGKWGGKDLPIKCLYFLGNNLLGNQMGPTIMREAFKKLDFIVVADPLMTYTAKYADLVLPISLSWEDEDHNGSFFLQKAVEPAGECRSDFAALKGIAEAMGYTDLYTKTQEEYLREALDTPENIEAGMGYDQWKEKGAFFGDYVPGDSLVVPESNATGRTQFYLESIPPISIRELNFTITDRMPSYGHALEAYKDNPLREKYPLFGLSNHNHYFGQSFTTHIPWLDEIRGYNGEPFVLLHEKAAAERGIKTGDTVRVFNDRGYLVVKAVLTTGLREDTVLVPRGYDTDEYIDGHPQDLVSLATDPDFFYDTLHDWICQVEKM